MRLQDPGDTPLSGLPLLSRPSQEQLEVASTFQLAPYAQQNSAASASRHGPGPGAPLGVSLARLQVRPPSCVRFRLMVRV